MDKDGKKHLEKLEKERFLGHSSSKESAVFKQFFLSLDGFY